MTVDVKFETIPVAEQPVKAVEQVAEKDECNPKAVEKSSSYREESNFVSDLKEHEKKALNEFKSKLEEAILGNTLFKEKEEEKKEKVKEVAEKKEESEEEKKTDDEKPIDCEKTDEEKPIECEKTEEEKSIECEKTEEEKPVDQDISIWGVPLLPSKGDEGTDVILLKFLRAREFKVNDAFHMLEKTLKWRKEFKIDSILDEEFDSDLAASSYISGTDKHGHPICYNVFGVLENEEIYEKTLATEEKRQQFLRWRVQIMEKGIWKLNFKPGGVNSLVQINDLKNSPGLSKKEVRYTVNKAVALLQDNYPEFVAKNIFINVPFWYFAFHSLLSPFLTQRSKSKFVFARPSKVTETLLKYIPIEEIPIQYGGIKRENDSEYFITDGGEVSEIVIKAGSTETIEIPTPEAGTTFTWDLLVLGWEVNYTEEFVPSGEDSYTVIIQKGKKICAGDEPIRNTFKNQEPGKIVLTVENASGKKKKAFYRYKIKKTCF